MEDRSPCSLIRSTDLANLVIKPLGPLVSGHPLISGTSLLVTGEVVLVLNLVGLSRWIQLENGGRAHSYSGPKLAIERTLILVVDDSISVRRVVAKQLRHLGYEVDEASDGLEAIGKVRSQRYAMVMTDLEMPRMDGFELLEELSRQQVTTSIPVLATSTRSDLETRRRVSGLGANAFVAKPIDPEELAETVKRLLDGIAGSPGGRPSTANLNVTSTAKLS